MKDRCWSMAIIRMQIPQMCTYISIILHMLCVTFISTDFKKKNTWMYKITNEPSSNVCKCTNYSVGHTLYILRVNCNLTNTPRPWITLTGWVTIRIVTLESYLKLYWAHSTKLLRYILTILVRRLTVSFELI
jgi:hypothetical protein